MHCPPAGSSCTQYQGPGGDAYHLACALHRAWHCGVSAQRWRQCSCTYHLKLGSELGFPGLSEEVAGFSSKESQEFTSSFLCDLHIHFFSPCFDFLYLTQKSCSLLHLTCCSFSVLNLKRKWTLSEESLTRV